MHDYALFVDFDGTLVDIAPRPDAVVVEPGLAQDLVRLKDRLGGALAIVTGRSIADIDGFLPGLGLDICGLHGLERRVAGRTEHPSPLPELENEIASLRRRLAAHPAVVLENKTVGIAVHWRLAPEAEVDAKAAASDLAVRLGPAYRLQDGKAVREIVPAGAGKGSAIRTLMNDPPYAGRRPIFVGDDKTDEHGFEAVDVLGGFGIKIGEGDTAARMRLNAPSDFRRWLRTWAKTGRIPL